MICMNSSERLITTLNHKEPDRIPFDIAGTTVTGINKKAFIKAMEFRGLSIEFDKKEIDPIQQIVTPVEETLKILRSDIRRIGARRIPGFENIVRKNGTVNEITDVWNCSWRMDDSKDLYYNQITFPLEGYPSLEDGLKSFRAPDISDEKELIIRDLNEQVLNISDYGMIADRNCAGLTEISLRVRGYETWFLDTVINPAAVAKLFDIIIEYKKSYWDLLIDWLFANNLQHRLNVVSECDDLGTQASTLLDPDFMRSAVIPRFADLWKHIKKRLPGIKIFMHTCGSVRVLLPDLIEAGLDIYNPVQFTAADMDLKGLKRDFGKDLVFWGGGVNTQSTLRTGTPQQVEDEVKRIMGIMAPGGGFVFSTVHNIQEDVPPENFWAMWDTLFKFGNY
jgi:uroporphyrinogen decarboxylase